MIKKDERRQAFDLTALFWLREKNWHPTFSQFGVLELHMGVRLGSNSLLEIIGKITPRKAGVSLSFRPQEEETCRLKQFRCLATQYEALAGWTARPSQLALGRPLAGSDPFDHDLSWTSKFAAAASAS